MIFQEQNCVLDVAWTVILHHSCCAWSGGMAETHVQDPPRKVKAHVLMP